MTIEIQVECDGFKCHRSIGYDGGFSEYLFERFLEDKGWHEIDGCHYCEKCGPRVLKEVEEEQGRREPQESRGGGRPARSVKPAISVGS
jgi:hypothetical protein